MNLDTFKKICEHIETSGDGTYKTCRKFNVSGSDFYDVVNASPENTSRYARSKDAQIDILAEQTLEIADECIETGEAVGKARLQVDARKWFASKLRPKKYGDKVDITSAGNEIKAPAPVINVCSQESADIIGRFLNRETPVDAK